MRRVAFGVTDVTMTVRLVLEQTEDGWRLAGDDADGFGWSTTTSAT